jgi:hypothetical protein
MLENFLLIYMKNLKTNLDWDRLNLKPVAERDLQKMLASGLVRFATAMDTGLTFMTGTRVKRIAGRQARRTKTGYWELYQSGNGWISLKKDSPYWLHP